MPTRSDDRTPPIKRIVGTVAVLGALMTAAAVVPRRWLAAMTGDHDSSGEQRPAVQSRETGAQPVPTPPETHENVPDQERLTALAFHTVPPTYWPAALALGVTLVGLGIITSLTFMAVGFVLVVIGLVGWIGDVTRG
ncbi:MAG TPA: cytochrome c oxidase subunit 4 [Thermomicrobiaceae bacterium]|nr:cytochrome c oxidase subunit 4 [Thermomicrobiaceae bacterium]